MLKYFFYTYKELWFLIDFSQTHETFHPVRRASSTHFYLLSYYYYPQRTLKINVHIFRGGIVSETSKKCLIFVKLMYKSNICKHFSFLLEIVDPGSWLAWELSASFIHKFEIVVCRTIRVDASPFGFIKRSNHLIMISRFQASY